MADAISVIPMVDILSTITQRVVVMADDNYVYRDDNKQVESIFLEEGLSKEQSLVAQATEQTFTNAIQMHLDNIAQDAKWDDMQSARACAGIPLDGTESDIETAMHADAVKLARWYLKVWAYGYAQLALIQSGDREIPTVEDFLEELPKV